jgi:hypothetical protein
MTRPDAYRAFAAERRLSDAEQRFADQQAYVRRMIMHGAPTQAAEDRLRELVQKLAQLRKGAPPLKAGA